ncbi:MAG: hypothetical protein ACM3JG_20580 [Thiohalocapsa sp.]
MLQPPGEAAALTREEHWPMWILKAPADARTGQNRLRCLVLLAVSLAAGYDARAATWLMPPDVTTRVGRAQEYVYNYTSSQYAALRTSNRDYVWSGEAPTGEALRVPVFTGINVPVWRPLYGYPLVVDSANTLYQCGTNQPCSYSWLNSNYPSWILRGADHATPAWEFGDRTMTPVDISNSAVSDFALQNSIVPLLNLGLNISLDNVDDRNLWDAQGVCSVAIPFSAYDSNGNPTSDATPVGDCESNGGRWTQVYTDPKTLTNQVDNGAFTTDQVHWMQAVTAKAHQLGLATSANISYDARDLSTKSTSDYLMRQLIAAVDIWYQESSFDGDAIPSACLIGGGSYAQAIAGTLTAGATTVPLTGTMPSGVFASGVPVSIAGAGAQGETYIGTATGAPSGQSVPISPATATTVNAAGGSSLQVAELHNSMFGQQWINYTEFIQSLPAGTAMVQENSICPIGNANRQVVEWAIGSNLISKPASKARSYVEMFFASADGSGDGTYDTNGQSGADWDEWSWDHGLPLDKTAVVATNGIYSRRFRNGIVVCNPTAPGSADRSFSLGNKVYHSFDNVRYSGTVSIPGPSCLMLQSGAP